MAKTKKNTKRSKSRRLKRGGRKNNMALQTSQMIGGQVGTQPQPRPAPAPASITLLGTLDEQSVINSLQSFGDATKTLQEAVAQGKLTGNSLESAVKEQQSALNSLQAAADSLYNSVANPVSGLFKRIVGTTFVATPEPPAPMPAPRPASA
jgi:hypothetical protein